MLFEIAFMVRQQLTHLVLEIVELSVVCLLLLFQNLVCLLCVCYSIIATIFYWSLLVFVKVVEFLRRTSSDFRVYPQYLSFAILVSFAEQNFHVLKKMRSTFNSFYLNYMVQFLTESFSRDQNWSLVMIWLKIGSFGLFYCMPSMLILA